LTELVVRLTLPAEPGGVAAPSTPITRTGPAAAAATDRRDLARAKERSNLKLALATFAVQLDAFEARAIGLLGAGRQVSRRATAMADQGKDGMIGQ
jgi:hypothetical protein